MNKNLNQLNLIIYDHFDRWSSLDCDSPLSTNFVLNRSHLLFFIIETI
ncbi:MAG: hypothetical protein HeimC2_42550 [Candidatus Heimdallarchaeota archaeon LC_2]|nr:MAG: hypothetical protein HeimC2_42550 [Candidatus Heimdallarchaeota archaeon LC_2]